MARQFVRKPASWAKRGPNARSFLGDESELMALAHSYLKRPLHPLVCKPDGVTYDGNRRLMGLELIGRLDAEVDICITDEALAADQVQEIQLVSAIHRADVPAHDKAVAMRGIKAARGLTNKQLADDVLNIDASLVTRYLSLPDCIPEVQQAAKEGKLGVSEWYVLSKLDPTDQPELLKLKLEGASRDTLERQARNSRAAKSRGVASAVRVPSIKVALANAISVVVRGESIDLEQGIEALKEALKAMTKARDTGLDAKTAQAVWRDIARNGG